MRQPALETLHKRRGPIAAVWWFGFLGGPVWVVVIAGWLIRRHREQGDLRWVA